MHYHENRTLTLAFMLCAHMKYIILKNILVNNASWANNDITKFRRVGKNWVLDQLEHVPFFPIEVGYDFHWPFPLPLANSVLIKYILEPRLKFGSWYFIWMYWKSYWSIFYVVNLLWAFSMLKVMVINPASRTKSGFESKRLQIDHTRVHSRERAEEMCVVR